MPWCRTSASFYARVPVGYNNGFPVFAFFESRIRPTALPEAPPPGGLVAFYWHFIRQTRGLYAAMFATGLCVALVDTAIPVFIGKLVTLMSADDRAAAFHAALPMLIGMAVLILVGRPVTLLADSLVRNNAVVPGVTSLIRWQSHWHVVRQSWPFFQNDFAGRIANRVMQTSNSLRESVVSSIRGIWYITIYGLSALVLMAIADWRLAIPTVVWFAGYVVCLRHFVPRMRDLAKASSEVRSHVMGRVVDSYTNILTVKLFARARDEDAYVREVLDEHQAAMSAHTRLITKFMATLATMNALLLVATAGIGITLWGHGLVSAGVVATALPLAWQIANVAGWVSWEVTGIFENIGVVQEGMETIAVPHVLVDAPGARELHVAQGEIRFTNVTFTYGRNDGRKVLDDLDLVVRPGERVGLVGRSGAGKSTLVNLLLRFHELEQGSIRIDGEDIRSVTQESLRAAIGMVTQDTSLLHRSIAANIGYGRPGATQAEIESAAQARPCARIHRRPHGLEDAHGIRSARRRARRQAVGRAAPAHRDRARHPQERADPGARRGDVRARQRSRARHPGPAARAHGRQDGDRDRAPALDDRAHGPPHRARSGPRRRGRHARRAAAPRRPLRTPVEAPVGWIPALTTFRRRTGALIDDGPVDEMRAEEQPEPSMNDEPIPSVTRTDRAPRRWSRACGRSSSSRAASR